MANDFKSYPHMFQQGAESRFTKAEKAFEAAEALLPDSTFDGNAADLRQAIKHLQIVSENLTELIVYRKMLGVD